VNSLGTGNYDWAIAGDVGSTNSNFNNITFYNFGWFSLAIRLYTNSINNNFYSPSFVSVPTTGYVIRLFAGNNSFYDTIGNLRIRLDPAATNIRMVNVSNITYEEIATGGSYLRQWYLNVQVNSSGAPINLALVQIYNLSGTLVASASTGIDGRINSQTITEYFDNGSIYYATPHTINTSKTGYITNTTIVNFTAKRNYNLFVNLLGSSPDVNYIIGTGYSTIRFLNCSPDWEFYPSETQTQTTSQGIINATNNGSGIGNFQIKLSNNAATGWRLFACPFSSFNPMIDVGCVNMNTSYQTIWSSVLASETKKIWLYANCSRVSSNPQASIVMQAT
jgi:hypothetical protein